MSVGFGVQSNKLSPEIETHHSLTKDLMRLRLNPVTAAESGLNFESAWVVILMIESKWVAPLSLAYIWDAAREMKCIQKSALEQCSRAWPPFSPLGAADQLRVRIKLSLSSAAPDWREVRWKSLKRSVASLFCFGAETCVVVCVLLSQ